MAVRLGCAGGFDPARSDLDVQAVSSARLPHEQRKRLAAELSHEALPCPVRGLEFVLYAREDLADEHGPAYQLNLNTGPRLERHEGFAAGDDPRFWFVLDVAIGREHGRALAGPPAAEVFPALPRALIAEPLREAIAYYRGLDPSGIQGALASCRAWAWAEEGHWLSKGEAARWAAGRADAALRLRA